MLFRSLHSPRAEASRERHPTAYFPALHAEQRVGGWPAETVLVRGALGVVSVDFAIGVSVLKGDNKVPLWSGGVGRSCDTRRVADSLLYSIM